MKITKSNNSQNSHKRIFNIFGAFAIVLIIIAALLSGVEVYREEVLNYDPDVVKEEQNTLYLASGGIDTLNPYISKSEDVYFLNELLYDSLFDYDNNLGYVSVLAKDFTVNTEKAYIDIELRDDVHFHGGSKFTSQDVSFSVSAVKAVGASSPYYNQVSKIVSVVSKDKYNLRIYFNNNYNCSLDDLVFPIVSRNGYSNAYKFANDKDDFKPNGTGIYKYDSADITKYINLVPNEEYFDNKAKNDIVINIIPKDGNVANLATIEYVTCYYEYGNNRKTTAIDNDFVIYDIPSNEVEFIVFETTSGYTRNKTFRQALCYAIDIDKIISAAYMDDAIPVDTVYYPDFMGVTDTNSYYSLDVNKTKELFDDYSLSDLNGDGYLENAGGKTIEINVLVKATNSSRLSAANIIKKNLESVGIKTNVTALKGKEYSKALSSKDFDIAIVGYEVQKNMDLRELFNGKNSWGYYNYNIFEQSRELDRIHTLPHYVSNYTELKDMLMDEVPYYAICYKKMSLIGVEGFNVNSLPTFANRYADIEEWTWIKTKDIDDTEDDTEDE